MPQIKMTVKDLSLEVEKLKQNSIEKDNTIEALAEKVSNLQNWAQVFCNKNNEMNQNSMNNFKILDVKITEVNEKLENQKRTDTVKPNIKCKECSLEVRNIIELKTHIQALHPKQYRCNNCDQTFCSSLDLELHMKTHSTEKNFKCDLCNKLFYMKWRLGKHMKQHEQSNVRYCSFYNNNQFCEYEEIGCMFRHEHAPKCKFSGKCRINLCQFKHDTILPRYPCNECASTFNSEGILDNHKRSEHKDDANVNKTVVDVGDELDDNGYAVCNDEVNGKPIDTSNKSDDEESDADYDENNTIPIDSVTVINPYNFSKPVRCLYGMCSFENIMFTKEKDFCIHLKCVHDIDRKC